ncbi:hypothetical protein Ancab_019208 [Ancistrocladus abbreviatus]
MKISKNTQILQQLLLPQRNANKQQSKDLQQQLQRPKKQCTLTPPSAPSTLYIRTDQQNKNPTSSKTATEIANKQPTKNCNITNEKPEIRGPNSETLKDAEASGVTNKSKKLHQQLLPAKSANKQQSKGTTTIAAGTPGPDHQKEAAKILEQKDQKPSQQLQPRTPSMLKFNRRTSES